MKIFVLIAFVAILASLAAAGVYMLRSGKDGDEAARGKRMARALTFRIGLSVALFLLVLLAYLMGWIQPTGLPLQR